MRPKRYLIQTALGSSPVITIFYRLGIRTHNQISVHSGGYQNALTQNAGALKITWLTRSPLDLSSK